MTANQKTVPDGPAACADLAALGKQLALNVGPMGLVAEAATARAAVERLRDGGFVRDAVRGLAHLLPVRRAVWWAILSAWHGVQGEPSSAQDRALAAAVRWVMEPSETNRTAADQAARDALLDNAPGCCACAAALAGCASADRFSAANVTGAAALAAQAVAFACYQREQAGLPTSFTEFLDVGLELFDDRPLDLEVQPGTA